MSHQNVRISAETHSLAVAHVTQAGKILGKFVDIAIREKLERMEKEEIQKKAK